VPVLGCSRELCADDEQLTLETHEQLGQLGVRLDLGAGGPERGDGLVDHAVCGRTGRVLTHATTEQQRGRAVITGARVHLAAVGPARHRRRVYGRVTHLEPVTYPPAAQWGNNHASGILAVMSLAPERADASSSVPPPSLAMAMLRTARPKQWVKNVLVFAAPLAAGVLTEPGPLGRTLVAFVALCLAASGTYFLNDALDAEADRQHPTKRNRPIAAGHLSVGRAKVIAVVLILAGIGISIPITHGELALVVAGYAVLTVSYSLWLKHEPVIDLAAVAAGFVLRAIAGGVAADVLISDWFLIVAAAGSLFMITGKRHAELIELGEGSGAHRRTLDEYTTGYLGFVRAVAASVMVTAYALWAFENASSTGDTTWFRLSIVPFVLAVLRYAFVIEQGHGGAPEEIVLSDRVLQILGLLWILAFAIGVNV